MQIDNLHMLLKVGELVTIRAARGHDQSKQSTCQGKEHFVTCGQAAMWVDHGFLPPVKEHNASLT